MNIHELAVKYEDYMISIRRHFHMYPELSLKEEKTSLRIQQELTEMGIPFDVVGHRNVVGRIEFARPGKRLAIRADIDALPMQEEIDSEFKSTVPGVMHACGHDVHAATLLAAAKCLTEMKDELSGTVYLCFQVAEEISGGGPQEIIEYLNSKGGVDEVIANHMTPALDPYVTSAISGPANAGNCQWRITVRGRGGHGSRPDLSIDPIRPATEILQKICSIPSIAPAIAMNSTLTPHAFVRASCCSALNSRPVKCPMMPPAATAAVLISVPIPIMRFVLLLRSRRRSRPVHTTRRRSAASRLTWLRFHSYNTICRRSLPSRSAWRRRHP